MLATLAWRDADLAYWRSQAPSLVPQAMAADPMVKTRVFEQFVSRRDRLSVVASAIGKNAAASLRSEPLDAVALRQLGMVAAVARADAARAYLDTAERISRRELTTQFLLIEQSAQDDDIAATLAHYDRVLQVYPSASQQFYPVLAKALTDMDVFGALKNYVSRAWTKEFLGQAIALGGGPEAVTDLFAESKAQLAPRDADHLAAAILGQLLERGHYALARDFVRRTSSGSLSLIDEIAMSSATSDARLSQLAWAFANNDAFETALDASGGLTIRVSSERSGMVAERVTLLAPGDYTFTQVVNYDAGTPHAKLSWAVRCRGEGSSGTIWQQQLPVAIGQTTYRSAFTVPKACAAQSWQLNATADETQIASVVGISRLALVMQ